MKTEIKELIDEMIEFEKLRKASKYLINAVSDLGEEEVYVRSGFILLWHKLFFLELEAADKIYLDDDAEYGYYKNLFEKCPELNSVFSLNNDYIGWSNIQTKEEQDEIRNYVHENYTAQIRIRRDYSRAKKK
jgi:hypothetical protein